MTEPSSPNLSLPSRLNLTIQSLPYLTREDLHEAIKDSCPICLTPFATLLAEGTALIDSQDPCLSSDPNASDNERPSEECEDAEWGVTKLMSCGHMFCRKDLAEWIRRLHGSCPTCRHVFLDIFPSRTFSRGWSRGRVHFADSDEEDDLSSDDSGISIDNDFWVDIEDPLSDGVSSPEAEEVDDTFREDDELDITEDHWVDAEDVRFLPEQRRLSNSAPYHASPFRSSPLRSSWTPT